MAGSRDSDVVDGDADLFGDLARDRGSNDSPGSTNPASTENRPCGQCAPTAEQQPVVGVDDRHDHGRVGARVVLPAVVGAAADPARLGRRVSAPHRGQCRWVACQFASASAVVKRPASRASRPSPACRNVSQAPPGGGRAAPRGRPRL